MAWTELRERNHSGSGRENEMKHLLKEIKEGIMELCEMMEEPEYGERRSYGERGDAWRVEREEYGERRYRR